MENGIKMVIGSYGSYAAANNKALGSKWLDLADFSDWSDILDELTAEGFEELFSTIDKNIIARA